MADFDGVINPTPEWADVPQLSTQAKALGGAGGPMNAQAVALTKRVSLIRNIAYPAIRKTVGDVLSKAGDGGALTVAFYGTSITYGQDTTATGTRPAANGATQTRSAQPIPENFSEALGFANFTGAISVLNRAFPGDSTIEGLSRWASAGAVDLAFIEYGHNDAMNYGNYAHGPVPLADYRRNLGEIIDREILKGAAVVVLGSTPVRDMAANKKIRAYAAAAKEVASQYGVPFVDQEEIIKDIDLKYTDGVHLSQQAYCEIGWMLAGLAYRRDASIQRVSAGDFFYATDGLWHSAAPLFSFSATKAGTGFVQSLNAGETLAIGVYCEDNCLPVIHSVNGTTTTTSIRAYYAGAKFTHAATLSHNPNKGLRQKLHGVPLKRGYRTILLRNEGTTVTYVEAIEFRSIDTPALSVGGNTKSAALTGAFIPRRTLAATSTIWSVTADYSRKLTAPALLSARVTLESGTLGSNQGGLCILQSRQAAGDFLSSVLFLALRDGQKLVLRDLVGGNISGTDTIVDGVFPAGTWTGEIALELTSNSVRVYIDGSLSAERTTTTTSGFAGVIGQSSSGLICHGAYFNGEEKGIY